VDCLPQRFADGLLELFCVCFGEVLVDVDEERFVYFRSEVVVSGEYLDVTV